MTTLQPEIKELNSLLMNMHEFIGELIEVEDENRRLEYRERMRAFAKSVQSVQSKLANKEIEPESKPKKRKPNRRKKDATPDPEPETPDPEPAEADDA